MKSENPTDLAARFLALWQEQWAESLADPETAGVMSALFNQLPGGMNAFTAPMSPAGAASGLAASMAGGRERAELARRIDALEVRVAEMEALLAGGGRKSAAKTRRAASTSAGRSTGTGRQSTTR